MLKKARLNQKRLPVVGTLRRGTKFRGGRSGKERFVNSGTVGNNSDTSCAGKDIIKEEPIDRREMREGIGQNTEAINFLGGPSRGSETARRTLATATI